MKKISDFIVDKRYFILILFIILSIISVIVSKNVNINDDMTKYLPSTSKTRIGMDIMDKDFADVNKTSSLEIMFKNLNNQEKLDIYKQLQEIENVSSVDYDDTEEYNKNEYTLYVINVDDTSDSQIATEIYNKVLEKYEDYDIQTSGSISMSNLDVLPKWIIVTAVLGVLIILLFMCESYIEPLLFLFCILIAILLNSGTNIIFDSVSVITNSISAILQLALSMDYSIMLMNRFRQEKENEKDKIKAMKKALHNAFKSISSSSITTVVGLVVLVFMTFTIGKDLGLVLAKGVLLSLISIFCVLPGLILIFDKLITKTKKKTLNIKLNKIGNVCFKSRKVLTLIFLIIFIGSFLLKGNLNILFTASEIDEIAKVFGSENQMAIIYKNEDEEKVSKYLKNIEEQENIKEVLGYSNTINEKLKAQELKEKLKEYSEDVDIEDYILKVIFYKYYNQNETNTITFHDMIKFIKNEVYNNPKTEEKLNQDTKDQVNILTNFADIDLINQERTADEIADILGIEKSNIDDILVYYNSKNNNLEISLNDFVEFMNNTVLLDSKYSKNVDDEAKESLKQLTKFTNKEQIKLKLTSKQMANLFDMKEQDMNSLYSYYISKNEINTKLTLSQFANFVLTDVLTNDNYSNMFDENTINSIKTLQSFSNTDLINKNMLIPELSNLFKIDEKYCMQLLLLKYMNTDNGTKLSISKLINESIKIKNTTNYLDDVDLSQFEKLAVFASNENNINTVKMNRQNLSNIFNNVSEGLVDKVYTLAGLPDEYLMTPQEFIDMVINNSSSGNIPIDETSLNNLKIIKLTIDSSISDLPITYTASEVAKILNVLPNKMYNLYALIDYTNANTKNWKSAPYEFVNLIINNKENEQVKSNISENQINNLNLLSTIMNSTLNNKKYTYSELASFINSDIDSIKNIYSLYLSKNTETKLTPIQFVNFVLDNKDSNLLKQNINENTIDTLKLLQSVIEGVTNDKLYSSNQISTLLTIDKEKVDLIYGLYISKNINLNQKISLNVLVNFILNDVITNEQYSQNFNNDAKLKLNTIQSIMKGTVNNTKYNKKEMIDILSNLSDKIDKNTIELLYLYYGSVKEYNENWDLTIEQFVNYLYENILPDNRFESFIDDEMRNDINNSKETIDESKNMLVGEEYSRIVINSKLDLESEETFNFIQKLQDTLEKDNAEFYVIGDSPMAYEMSKTFKDEFNYISVLTMIAIFLVIVVTFKSILIPLILVAVIQCSVYMTMGILSLSGGSVYYLALLIVQSILMGSTIDYAILYTSYYLEYREFNNKKEALINAYNESIHTILTSASILIIVTFIVGKFATEITSKICITLSKGTLCAEVLILVFLPALLSILDKLIIKRKS